MASPSIFFLFFFPAALVFGHLHPTNQTTIEPRMASPGDERMALAKHRDRQQRSVSHAQDNPECQEGIPLGASYSGKVNHTLSGRSCQAWATSEPHEPRWTDVGKVGETEAGDHNYCRNPNPHHLGGVWCYTTDPDKRMEQCAVPICGAMFTVLDFSSDNDQLPDGNGEYTSATLEAGVLPESFTICSAFMVEAWTTEFSGAPMFLLSYQNDDAWGAVIVGAGPTFTRYSVVLGSFVLNKDIETRAEHHFVTNLPISLVSSIVIDF